MKNWTQTIRKMVGFLSNPEEDGGFWLPNIQTPFVNAFSVVQNEMADRL